jgi:hypothetical protein
MMRSFLYVEKQAEGGDVGWCGVEAGEGQRYALKTPSKTTLCLLIPQLRITDAELKASVRSNVILCMVVVEKAKVRLRHQWYLSPVVLDGWFGPA